MVRIYIADGLAEERSALKVMLRSLDMMVVGEAADWVTTLDKAPTTQLDILLVDWDLLPEEAGTALELLRAACPRAIIVILISHMDARQQAALSTGADVFISKGEPPERVAERLRGVAAKVGTVDAAAASQPTTRSFLPGAPSNQTVRQPSNPIQEDQHMDKNETEAKQMQSNKTNRDDQQTKKNDFDGKQMQSNNANRDDQQTKKNDFDGKQMQSNNANRDDQQTKKNDFDGKQMQSNQTNREDHGMNKDEFEGKWKQVRGQVRQWWGKLTDDDLERIGGKHEELVGVVQERYGYTREAAETEVNKRMTEFDATQTKRNARP